MTPAVAFEHVALAFDDTVVLRDVTFSVPAGGMLVLLGASGSGKTLVLKLMLGLLRPDAGAIHLGGERVDSLTEAEWIPRRAGIGMLFQESALFDSLTVGDNVGYRLYEETDMPRAQVAHRVLEVLDGVGLRAYVDTMPSDLSGGQRRRVALARAMAARPQLLLLDSPTSGLDPITAKTVDAAIITLRDLEDVTTVMVTHQIEDAFYVAGHRAVRSGSTTTLAPAESAAADRTRFLMLHDGVIAFAGTAAELHASGDPYLKRFLAQQTGISAPL